MHSRNEADGTIRNETLSAKSFLAQGQLSGGGHEMLTSRSALARAHDDISASEMSANVPT